MEVDYTQWQYCSDARIRCKKVTYKDEIDGEVTDWCFEIFKRPFFWGLIGKKRWEMSMQTNSFRMGHDFSAHLLK